MEGLFGYAEDPDPDDWGTSGPDHPAARRGLVIWYTCKHCPAWMEWTGDDDENGEPLDRWETAVHVPTVHLHRFLDGSHAACGVHAREEGQVWTGDRAQVTCMRCLAESARA